MRPSAQASGQLIAGLEALLDGPTGLSWLRSVVRRQQSQPWQPIKCGPSLEPVSSHISRFRSEWASALRSIASACPAAASECAALLQLDPLDPRNDAAIGSAIVRIRRLSDPHTVRSMARQRERCSFGAEVRRLRLERGLSLRGLARACKEAAQRLGFGLPAPDRFQLMDYERGRSNAHPRTKVVLATALGVTADQICG